MDRLMMATQLMRWLLTAQAMSMLPELVSAQAREPIMPPSEVQPRRTTTVGGTLQRTGE